MVTGVKKTHAADITLFLIRVKTPKVNIKYCKLMERNLTCTVSETFFFILCGFVKVRVRGFFVWGSVILGALLGVSFGDSLSCKCCEGLRFFSSLLMSCNT